MSENPPDVGGSTPGDARAPEPPDRRPAPAGDRRVGGVRVDPSPGDDPQADATGATGATGASPVRGVGLALLAATIGAATMVVLGGPFAFSYGLIVPAYFIGRFASLGLRAGAGSTISATNRVTVAILVSLFAVALGFLGLWVFATGEGGRLTLIDYLATVYGALVPLQFMIATLSAWWSSR